MSRTANTLLVSLIAILLIGANPPSKAPPRDPLGIDSPTSSATGPKSDEERDYLERNGRSAFGDGRYKQAAHFLQRLVDRYPASANYLDMRLLLGVTYHRLKKPALAVQQLRYVVQAAPHSIDAYRTRLTLARAFIQNEQLYEALSTSEEVVSAKGLPPEIYLEGLLVKAWAAMALEEDDRAERTLAAFQTESRKHDTDSISSLLGQSHRVEIELKLRHCNRFPSGATVDEDVLRDQLKRKASCLNESLVMFKQQIDTRNSEFLLESRRVLSSAFEAFNTNCRNPPSPPGKRTAEELSKYRNEMRLILKRDCADYRERSLALLDHWKGAMSERDLVHLAELNKSIRGKDAVSN